MKRENIDKIFRFLLVVGIYYVLSFFIFYIWKVTYPFMIAIAIAIFINPAVNFLENKWRFPRGFAVLTTLILYNLRFCRLHHIINC